MAPHVLRKMSDPKVTLVYPPNQTLKDSMCKPNGSLAYPNLGGSLMARGVEGEVFTAQEIMVLNTAKLIKAAYPYILVVAAGDLGWDSLVTAPTASGVTL